MLQIVLALIITGVAAVTAQCPDGNWTEHGESCYKWFNSPNFWLVAEQTCLSHGAHLVSIRSERENRLVGRLSNCTNTWIGRFGSDLNRLSDPTTYSWTDGSDATKFHRHNFSQLDSVHKPLIRTNGEWWLNSLYHESHPFVCKAQARVNSAHNGNFKCSDGWSLFQRHCYIIPNVEKANFNEANFYCQRKSAQLVSVMSEAELRYINTLDLSSDTCETSLDTVWIGLIKLNPCFPDSAGRELCYQWTDFSGKHAGFPNWETGHPISEDWTVNCVTLRGDRLHSDKCHNRHRFVCKAPAVNGTDGGGIETPDGLVAAFDFRKGLQNLVDPATYPVFDDFGIPRNSEDGACFSTGGEYMYYRIGEGLHLNQTIVAGKQWTMFFRSSFVNASLLDWRSTAFGAAVGSEPSIPLPRMPLIVPLHVLDRNPYSGVTTVYVRNVSDPSVQSVFSLNATSYRNDTWNDYAIAMNDQELELVVNEQLFSPYHIHTVRTPPISTESQKIFFGILYSRIGSAPADICARCMGLVEGRLSERELQSALTKYCS